MTDFIIAEMERSKKVRPQWELKKRARRAALTPDLGVIGQRGFELLLYRLLSAIALG